MRLPYIIGLCLCFTCFAALASTGGSKPLERDSGKDSLESNVTPRIEFEAHRDEQLVELRWAVMGFVKYFYIERSLDRESWDPILSMSGSNETYHRTEYFDIDYDVPSTKLYYRIKQVYYSGETSSSHIAFVPPYDDLAHHQERLIQSISDPIKVGTKIQLDFINFKGNELLLVLRDQCNIEYYAKVSFSAEENLYEVVDLSAEIPSGEYMITASSKKNIYSSSLRIEYTD